MPHVDLRPDLTPSQLRIITAIANGEHREQTATRLRVSEATIARETRHACTELNVDNHAALVNAAIRHSLLTIEPTLPIPIPEHLHQVLVLVADGLSNEEIATRLWLSLDGVKSRMQRLRSELGAVDRAHAVLIGHQRGLLSEWQWQAISRGVP